MILSSKASAIKMQILQNIQTNGMFEKGVKSKPMCVSGIGFQFHTPGTKENILREK